MEKVKEELKCNKKGITLISLVVTIVVLLILAGVSIATLTGNNGLLTKASESKEKTEEAQEKENIGLAVTTARIGDNGYQELNQLNLQDAIDNQFGEGKATVIDNGDGTFTVSLSNNGNIYNVGDTIEKIEVYLYISNSEELKAFRDEVNNGNTFKGKYIQLTNNINLNNEEWTPIGCLTDYSSTPYADTNRRFSGIFDGNGYEISGIYINTTNKVQGLFGLLDDGKIFNLGIGTSEIKGGNATAGIVGYLYNKSTINNCYNRSNISVTFGGGIAGCAYTDSKILNCSNSGTITGNSQTGGIVGLCRGNSVIENCSNYGLVEGVNSVGGIVGLIDTKSNIVNCKNTQKIIGDSKIGGISGETGQTIIDKCYNYGIIESQSSAGGITGQQQNESIVKNCSNSALISGKRFTGGIVGFNNYSTIALSFNSGNINGENNNTGGICGKSENNASIENCYNVGNIVSTGYYTGGILGSNQTSSVNNCYNVGNIQCENTVGGIVGYIVQGTFDNSFYLEGIVNGGNGNNINGVQCIDSKTLKTIYKILGNSFKEDINDINNGYPILYWQ